VDRSSVTKHPQKTEHQVGQDTLRDALTRSPLGSVDCGVAARPDALQVVRNEDRHRLFGHPPVIELVIPGRCLADLVAGFGAVDEF